MHARQVLYNYALARPIIAAYFQVLFSLRSKVNRACGESVYNF